MIVAVVTSYWIERMDNIVRIIDDLQAGTVVPDKIIVLNNNKDLPIHVALKTIKKSDNVELVNSTKNLGHRARYILALTVPSDYYFFIDDDVTVGPKTMENYLSYADENCCLGMWGKLLNNKPGSFYRGKEISSKRVSKLEKADLLIGRGTTFCSFNAIVNMLELEKKLVKMPEYEDGRDADITLGMANSPSIVPADDSSMFIGLNEAGVGYVRQKGHFSKRDFITERIYEIKKG